MGWAIKPKCEAPHHWHRSSTALSRPQGEKMELGILRLLPVNPLLVIQPLLEITGEAWPHTLWHSASPETGCQATRRLASLIDWGQHLGKPCLSPVLMLQKLRQLPGAFNHARHQAPGGRWGQAHLGKYINWLEIIGLLKDLLWSKKQLGNWHLLRIHCMPGSAWSFLFPYKHLLISMLIFIYYCHLNKYVPIKIFKMNWHWRCFPFLYFHNSI